MVWGSDGGGVLTGNGGAYATSKAGVSDFDVFFTSSDRPPVPASFPPARQVGEEAPTCTTQQ